MWCRVGLSGFTLTLRLSFGGTFSLTLLLGQPLFLNPFLFETFLLEALLLFLNGVDAFFRICLKALELVSIGTKRLVQLIRTVAESARDSGIGKLREDVQGSLRSGYCLCGSQNH